MGRKQPFSCPVMGCHKRGSLSDLARHARVKHPAVTAKDYAYAVTTRHVLRDKLHYQTVSRPWWPLRIPALVRRRATATLSIGLSGAVCIMVLMLAVTS